MTTVYAVEHEFDPEGEVVELFASESDADNYARSLPGRYVVNAREVHEAGVRISIETTYTSTARAPNWEVATRQRDDVYLGPRPPADLAAVAEHLDRDARGVVQSVTYASRSREASQRLARFAAHSYGGLWLADKADRDAEAMAHSAARQEAIEHELEGL